MINEALKANALKQRKKIQLNNDLFKIPFTETEIKNIILSKDGKVCESCHKLSANLRLKPENLESVHKDLLCFKTSQKCKKKNNNKNNNNINNNNDNFNNNNNLMIIIIIIILMIIIIIIILMIILMKI